MPVKKAKKLTGFFNVGRRKFLFIGGLITVIIAGGAILAEALMLRAVSAKSMAEYKQAIVKYLEGSEKFGNPVNIRYQKDFYYFVPIEVNKELSLEFPGVMLNKDAKPVTDGLILKELYKYPAVVREFSSTLNKFEGVAKSKATAVKKYCNIVSRERIKLGEIVYSGNVVGVIYQGTKLAFDAVSLVQNVPAGLATLAKDLAKGKVQDAVVSYFVPTDSREVLDSAQLAYDAADKAYKACNGLYDAWSVMPPTSGKVETLKAGLAVHSLFTMFNNEVEAISHLRSALDKVNNYPELITKINEKHFTDGMSAMDALIAKLEIEREYWRERDASVTANAEAWRDEQLRRINEMVASDSNILPSAPAVERLVASPSPATPSSKTSVLNLADGYDLYTFSKQASPCNTYQNSVSSNQVNLRCQNSSAHWRAHWVKKVDTAGYSKLQIKANLALNDSTHFFTECGGKGVKYDNYVDLIAVSSDPNPTLSAECNRLVSDADWPKCAVNYVHSSAITHCGIPKCGTSRSCDFEVSLAGRDSIYLVFYATDPWLASIEGVLSDAKITLTK